LPSIHLNFDLNNLKFPFNDIHHPVQTTCYFIYKVIQKKKTKRYDIYPEKNPFNKFNENYEKFNPSKPLKRERVLTLLKNHFINDPDRKGEVTFSNLLLFCKMAANEFRNLNFNSILNYKEVRKHCVRLDVSLKKPELFKTVLQICIRATNQSVEAIKTQNDAFKKLDLRNVDHE
jgi:hypothetical protein